MSIAGISGSSSDIYQQYLQSLFSASSTGTTASQTVGPTDSDGDSDGSGSTQSTGSTSNSQGASSSNSSAPSLIQQLETAIQSALNGVSSSQSSNSQTLLSSIEQALQPNNSPGSLLPAANGSSSSVPSATTSSSSTSSTPSLNSLLSQLNIDPQQFRNDIISALSGTQNGNVSPSQVFQNFPPGQSLNVLA